MLTRYGVPILRILDAAAHAIHIYLRAWVELLDEEGTYDEANWEALAAS